MNVDMSNIDKIIDSIEKEIHNGMSAFSSEIEKSWREKAESSLHTSKKKYLDSLSVEVVGEGARVTLDSPLATYIETGSERFDLKPGFLGSGIKKIIPIDDGDGPVKFRTVGKNSPQGSWWHPGIQARAMHKQVEAEIPEITKKVFGNLISKIKV